MQTSSLNRELVDYKYRMNYACTANNLISLFSKMKLVEFSVDFPF